jgi:hypothetical protein
VEIERFAFKYDFIIFLSICSVYFYQLLKHWNLKLRKTGEECVMFNCTNIVKWTQTVENLILISPYPLNGYPEIKPQNQPNDGVEVVISGNKSKQVGATTENDNNLEGNSPLMFIQIWEFEHSVFNMYCGQFLQIFQSFFL